MVPIIYIPKMKQGRIWAVTNPDNKNEFIIFPSFNKKDREVKSLIMKRFAESTPWLKNAIYEVKNTVEVSNTTELENEAEEVKKAMIESLKAPQQQQRQKELIIPPEIEEIFNEFEDIKAITIKNYLSVAKRYLTAINNGKWSAPLFYDMERVKAYANDKVPVRDHWNYYLAIQRMQKAIFDYNNELLTRLKKESQDQYKREAIEKVEEKAISTTTMPKVDASKKFNELVAIREKIEDKNGRNYLIASLMTKAPPKRPASLVQLTIKQVDEPHNYINLKTGTVRMNVTKTIRATKANTQKIPPEALEDIKRYVKANNIVDYLLPMKANTLTQAISRIFNGNTGSRNSHYS